MKQAFGAPAVRRPHGITGDGGLKKLLRVILSKTFAFAILFVVQVALLCVLVYMFASAGIAAYAVLTGISLLVVVSVLGSDFVNPAYKLIWLVVVVVMPVFGAIFYLLWGHRQVPTRILWRMKDIDMRANVSLRQDVNTLESLARDDAYLAKSANYLFHHAFSPLYPCEEAEYYPVGEEFFPRFLEEIRKAKRYIFMQYYIMEPGVMLDTAVEVLAQKAAEGVDVRIIWDGFGSMFTMPNHYAKMMREKGIKCHVYSPLRFTFHISHYAMLNHRDHRKLTVIDEDVAFTGGLNFADEYINEKVRFGYWKDTALLVRGEAAYSMTTTFLRSWDYVAGTKTEFEAYRPEQSCTAPRNLQNGYLQPYWDSPLDEENVSENAYLNVLFHARDYVYICTPYLILDYEMITSLTLAAKSGVDVRIITPGIPDKKLVFLVTQSFYPVLLREGVRIYEYTPGFNHAKMYVSDDKHAIVGSANMDFRSLYLHFENCVAFYGGHMVGDVKRDMLAMFDASHEVTLEEIRKTPALKRAVQVVAKFFAPML